MTPSEAAPRERGFADFVATGQHTLAILPSMKALLAQLRADLSGAKRRIWIETYIYRSDQFGWELGRELAEAVRRGVSVRLLYDALGSQASDPVIFDWMKRHGIETRAYRPKRVVLGTGRLFPRDHSRNVLVDDAGYLGGAAWGNEWLPKEEGGEGWHEVCVRAEGPCVSAMEQAFERRWREHDDDDAGRWAIAFGPTKDGVEYATDSPLATNLVHARHLERIRSARRRIVVENAYFVPTRDMFDAMVAAARRGVHVAVIVPRNTDMPIVRCAMHERYPAWLRAGFEIHEYPGTMMHAKVTVIDDWACIGTYNANATSIRWSHESAFMVTTPAFVKATARVLGDDLAVSKRVWAPPAASLLERGKNVLASLALRWVEARRDQTHEGMLDACAVSRS